MYRLAEVGQFGYQGQAKYRVGFDLVPVHAEVLELPFDDFKLRQGHDELIIVICLHQAIFNGHAFPPGSVRLVAASLQLGGGGLQLLDTAMGQKFS
jgi:hypothetical protein